MLPRLKARRTGRVRHAERDGGAPAARGHPRSRQSGNRDAASWAILAMPPGAGGIRQVARVAKGSGL